MALVRGATLVARSSGDRDGLIAEDAVPTVGGPLVGGFFGAVHCAPALLACPLAGAVLGLLGEREGAIVAGGAAEGCFGGNSGRSWRKVERDWRCGWG